MAETDADKAAGLPIEATLGGRTWKFAPVRFVVYARFAQVLKDQRAAEAVKDAGDCPLDERLRVAREARQSVDDDAVQAFGMTPEGLVCLLHLCAEYCQPVTVDEMAIAVNAAEGEECMALLGRLMPRPPAPEAASK